MGRLFWKIFLFIWLGQMAAVLGTGALFWIERQQFHERLAFDGAMPPPEFRDHRPPPAFDRLPPPPHRPRLPINAFPILPMLAGLIASLFCAAGLAWYFAQPIKYLRRAFAAVAEGHLEARVSPEMKGRRDELADLGRDFDQMTERLQALMAGQKQLLHDVSHEMRSPLARLQALIGLARQQPGRLEDTLQRIEREGGRMNLLVGELLTLSRLEAGVAGSLEAVELDELLANIVQDARFEGTARQVEINYLANNVSEKKVEIQANPELLHRAIENVVRNALRFSPVGGVVEIAAGSISPGCFYIAIGDSGPGVPDSQLEKIFESFFRGDAENSAGGYGLGLAIASRVIATVHGQIKAKNKTGGGFLVEIYLPVSAGETFQQPMIGF